MKIGINFNVIDISTSENVGHYLRQMKLEMHDLKIIADCQAGIAQKWLYDQRLVFPIFGVEHQSEKIRACKDLDVYVDGKLVNILPFVEAIKYPLLFSGTRDFRGEIPSKIIRVSSWSDIYDYIWNEAR